MRGGVQQTLKHPEQHKVQQLQYNNTHTTTHSTYSTSTCHLSPVQSVGFSSGTTTIGYGNHGLKRTFAAPRLVSAE